MSKLITREAPVVTVAEPVPTLRAQPGPQREFAACKADVAIFGGSAGPGKSWSLVYEGARNVHVPGYSGILFRRISKQLQGGGSVWSEAQSIYPYFGGLPREGQHLDWTFPSGSTMEFGHLQHAKDATSHQSKSYAYIAFDELSQFLESQFWFLFGRMRTTCGVRPYLRAATNPVPEHDKTGGWLRKLIDWWIGDDGLPIHERSGVLRWMVRVEDEINWANTPDELRDRFPGKEPKSFTFIGATLKDNPILTKADPGYESTLDMLPRIQRMQMKDGNWNIKATSGMFFQGGWCEIVDVAPADALVKCRAWDRAATQPSPENPDPDWTAGVKYSRDKQGTFYIEHVVKDRIGPAGVERLITNTAELDGKGVKIGLWVDPGAAGKADHARFVKLLAMFTIHAERAAKDKQTYFDPVSSQAENGNIKLVRGPWLDAYVSELEAFPEGGHDDQVDATSLCHIVCANDNLDHLRRMAKR